MKTTLSTVTLSFAISSAAFSQLTLEPSWGSQSSASLADRIFTSSSTNFNFAPSNGGAGALTSSNSLTESRGTATSFGQLDATSGISVPVIRTFAATGPTNSVATGSTVVIEGYTYNGAAPATFNLDANLSGSFSNIATDFAGNFATLSIWSPSGGGFFSSVTPTAGLLAPVDDPLDGFFFSTDEGSYLEFGFNRLDTIRLEQNGIGTDDLLSGTLTWNMNPGETVYLWASGRSQALGPNSTADARNTLTTSFQDSTGLTSLSGGVIPEPSTALLGLLGLFVFAHRKR